MDFAILFDRILFEYGTAIFTVKEEITFNERTRKPLKLYLHSFKLDSGAENNERLLFCNLFSVPPSTFYLIKIEVKKNTLNKWQFYYNDDHWEKIKKNDNLGQYLNSDNFTILSGKIRQMIESVLNDFLPTGKSFKFAKALLKSSVDNLGLITSTTTIELNSDEEKYYLSNHRIINQTKTKLTEFCGNMDFPDKTLISDIELNGAFRISFT